VLLLLYFASGSLQQSCETIPLAISSFDTCENGICRTSTTAAVAATIDHDSTSCVRVTTGTEQVFEVKIKFIHPIISTDLAGCYYTGDPSASGAGICGCPLGSAVSCSNCPTNTNFRGNELCLEGTHTGFGCLIHAVAPYCYKVGFAGVAEYKVCQMNVDTFKGLVEVTAGQNKQIIELTGVQSYSLFNNTLNITFSNINFHTQRSNQFIFFSLLDPNTFFYATPNEINDRLTTEPGLLGWFRPNQKVNFTNALDNFIFVQSLDCSQDRFHASFTLPTFRNFIKQKPERVCGSWSPGTILIDGEFEATSNDFFNIENEIDLTDGIVISSIDETPYTIGVDSSGRFIQNGPLCLTTSTFRLSNLQLFPGTLNCECNFTRINSVVQTWVKSCVLNDGVYGFCTASTSTGTGLNCNNNTINARSYPLLDNLDIIWNGDWNITYTGSTPPALSSIMTPINGGNGLITIEMKNITFAFEVTNVVPIMTDVEFIDRSFRVSAKSGSVPGSCLLTVAPGLINLQTISLALTINEYIAPAIVSNFTGTAIITITCFKNVDKVQLEVRIDPTDIIVNTNNVTDGRIIVKNKSFWQSAFDVISWPFNALWGFAQWSTSGIENNFLHGFTSVLFALGVVVAVGLVGFTLYKFVINRINNMMSSRSKRLY
jgi:hypothetical protein